MPYRHSTDKNQVEIISTLAVWGYHVCNVSAARNAGLDIIVAHPAYPGVNLLVEIKQFGKRGDLRPSERRMRDEWPGPWIVATEAEEIMRWFTRNT